MIVLVIFLRNPKVCTAHSDIIDVSEPLSIKARKITDLPSGDQTETLAVSNRTI